ncbi:uncharacterized protein LOC115411218 isoform X2 [Sphaeramia orbicularis]|nr:uncharacterized protein LOC115411218 isoform X2 [Sphaeramia orbicularis]
MPSHRKSLITGKHLKANTKRQRSRRAAESSSERERRLAQNAAAMRARRQNETSTERAQRLARNAAATRARRQNETSTERAHRLAQNAAATRARRQNETSTEKLKRQATDAIQHRTRIQNENEAQRKLRLQQRAERRRQRLYPQRYAVVRQKSPEVEPFYMGAMDTLCDKCGALRFPNEAQSCCLSSEQLLVRGGAGAGNGNWDATSGMDQITVVRIDDTHITGEQVNPGGTVCYEMECTMPTEEVVAEDDEEEDNVFVIEYSNPEEEGESYQFTMSVDRSVPAKKPIVKHPVVREHTREPLPVMQKPRTQVRRKPKVQEEEEEQEEQQEVKFERKRRMLECEEANSSVREVNKSERTLKCPLCPSPGKFFRRASGLAVHLKHMHHKEGNKTFFCITCKQTVRSQVELDAHTRRHAIKEAVFTCLLCTTEGGEKKAAGYRGTRLSLKSHLKTEHPGIIPRCDICNRGFKTLDTYLADQFRHVGVSPYYCAECKIYEMTERGLALHMKNDEKKKKKMQQPKSGEKQLQMCGDNSATDDSDF